MTQNNADLLLAYCKINIGGDNEMGRKLIRAGMCGRY
jgi:hypothetical protein